MWDSVWTWCSNCLRQKHVVVSMWDSVWTWCRNCLRQKRVVVQMWDSVNVMQELFEKLMRLTRMAQDDYTSLTSSALQLSSQSSSSSVDEHRLQADSDVVTTQQALRYDKQQQHTACFSGKSRQRNGFTVVHSSVKNCSVPSGNGLQQQIVDKISVRPRSPSCNHSSRVWEWNQAVVMDNSSSSSSYRQTNH